MRKANYYFSFFLCVRRENRVHLYGLPLSKRKSNGYDRTFFAHSRTNVQLYKFGFWSARFFLADCTQKRPSKYLTIRVEGMAVQLHARILTYWTSSKKICAHT